ncbi:hypothetical protein FRC11_011864 [Ceratobasidium sp. 423]|nr:hypothetical protein FRC11_011864 [Ceratobasidium sp. 423]
MGSALLFEGITKLPEKGNSRAEEPPKKTRRTEAADTPVTTSLAKTLNKCKKGAEDTRTTHPKRDPTPAQAKEAGCTKDCNMPEDGMNSCDNLPGLHCIQHPKRPAVPESEPKSDTEAKASKCAPKFCNLPLKRQTSARLALSQPTHIPDGERITSVTKMLVQVTSKNLHSTTKHLWISVGSV